MRTTQNCVELDQKSSGQEFYDLCWVAKGKWRVSMKVKKQLHRPGEDQEGNRLSGLKWISCGTAAGINIKKSETMDSCIVVCDKDTISNQWRKDGIFDKCC